MEKNQFSKACQWIDESSGILIAAGAGMGVDSGLPDFRSREGFWKSYPGLRNANLSFIEIANPNAFLKNPRIAWGFYGHRLNLYRKTIPHEGFSILKKWGMSRPFGVSIFTSNVDGQFHKAGFFDGSIYECHGSIHHLQCSSSCSDSIWSAADFFPNVDEERCLLLNDLPMCPNCGSVARPNILMFDDDSWISQRSDLQEDEMFSWIKDVDQLLIIELGAGTAVPTVRNFVDQINAELSLKVIRINLNEPEVPRSNSIGLSIGALSCLVELDQRLSGFK